MAGFNKVYFLFCAVIYLNLLGQSYSERGLLAELDAMNTTLFKLNEKLDRINIRLNESKLNAIRANYWC